MRHNPPPLILTAFALLAVGAIGIASHLGGIAAPVAVVAIAGSAVIFFYVLVKNEAYIRDEIAVIKADVELMKANQQGILAREFLRHGEEPPR
jgi:hypothetical protein